MQHNRFADKGLKFTRLHSDLVLSFTNCQNSISSYVKLPRSIAICLEYEWRISDERVVRQMT